jgi:hypothetical protein
MMTAEPAAATIVEDRNIPFRSRVDWDSFNELAKEVGSAGLRQLEPGTLAHLRVKQASFVLAREEDFQQMAGLAADAERLQGMLVSLIDGIDLAAEHEDPKIFAWLRSTARQWAEMLRPRSGQQDLVAGIDDLEDDEPAPRNRRQPAVAGRG